MREFEVTVQVEETVCVYFDDEDLGSEGDVAREVLDRVSKTAPLRITERIADDGLRKDAITIEHVEEVFWNDEDPLVFQPSDVNGDDGSRS